MNALPYHVDEINNVVYW